MIASFVVVNINLEHPKSEYVDTKQARQLLTKTRNKSGRYRRLCQCGKTPEKGIQLKKNITVSKP